MRGRLKGQGLEAHTLKIGVRFPSAPPFEKSFGLWNISLYMIREMDSVVFFQSRPTVKKQCAPAKIRWRVTVRSKDPTNREYYAIRLVIHFGLLVHRKE